MYYRIRYDVKKYSTYLPDGFDYDMLYSYDGRPKLKNWKGLHLHKMDPRDKRPLADFTDGIVPACNEKAKLLIEGLCANYVEFLPCTIGENNEKYYLMNILQVEDCVDYEKSSVVRDNNGELVYFKHIEFSKEIDAPVFILKDLKGKFHFTSEKFKQLVNENKLTGLIFDDEYFK